LASALEKYALAEEKVGEARLAQDAQIQSRFLAGWSTTLNTNLQFATKARKSVENSRLMLDSTKAAKKSAIQGRGMNPDDEGHLSEEARAEIEAAEDEFVNQTEEAVGVMKNVRHAGKCSSLTMANPQHRYSTRLNLYATWQT
jgi:Bin/amphiphysin/Rvs domain for vesicular trafficking